MKRIILFSLLAVLVLSWRVGSGSFDATATAMPVQTPTLDVFLYLPVALKPPATPTPLALGPYTGMPVADQTIARRWPILVCINNDSTSRSVHTGLSRADLVYEYIIDEFTMTRITAIYQTQDAEKIRPVRSARMPNIWITDMYDGVLAASGGSDAERYLLKNEANFPYLDADIDDPTNTRYFSSEGNDFRTRLSTSTEGVRRWLTDNGLSKDWNVPGFQFSQQSDPNPDSLATIIDIPYPGGNSVQWRYDSNQGGYIRFQAGEQAIDHATGQSIVAQNVAVMFAKHTLTDIVVDSLGARSVDIKLYDGGDFRIFRDGQVYAGTWQADAENPPRWLRPGGIDVTLKPGQTWIQVVRDTDEISYQ